VSPEFNAIRKPKRDEERVWSREIDYFSFQDISLLPDTNNTVPSATTIRRFRSALMLFPKSTVSLKALVM